MVGPPREYPIRFLPVRDGALLVELNSLDSTLSLMASLGNTPIDGINELIPAARTILIAFDPDRVTQPELISQISNRNLDAVSTSIGPLIEIPVRYDGEDLSEMASMLGMTVSELVHRHSSGEYTVAFTGFAPGFAYLAGGDPKLSVPRRATPRAKVPAGSVAIAGEFSGVYPADSPGGWQLIGSTPLKMFDLDRAPVVLLQPGFRVRFVDTSGAKPTKPKSKRSAPNPKPFPAVAQIDILSTLFPLLFQDEGRPGKSSQGVSISGAADKSSYRIANRLVGNKPGTAVLEITFGQVRFSITGEAFMALTGAPAAVTIQSVNGATTAAGRYEVIALRHGDVVSIASPQSGLRSYLAVRGGFDVQPTIDSASYDALAQIGPAPLVTGAQIGILRPPANAIVSTSEAEPFPIPAAGQTVVLDITLGPRTDWFTEDSIRNFLSQEWEVTAQSSRIGLRLKGTALERVISRELPSEATIQGAIQVPASGQPVLFLTDHPVTGGYPVIANIAIHHLDLTGQLPPGARVKFRASKAFAEQLP